METNNKVKDYEGLLDHGSNARNASCLPDSRKSNPVVDSHDSPRQYQTCVKINESNEMEKKQVSGDNEFGGSEHQESLFEDAPRKISTGRKLCSLIPNSSIDLYPFYFRDENEYGHPLTGVFTCCCIVLYILIVVLQFQNIGSVLTFTE